MVIRCHTKRAVAAFAVALALGALAPETVVAATPKAKAVKAAQPEMSESAVRSEHQKALSKALKGDVKGGLRALQVLAKNKMPKAEGDRVLMTIGRLNYELGNYEAAIIAFDQVDKLGPSYLESLEEMAWAKFRNGSPESSIATLKTVTSPAFKGQVRSEPFFLMGLAQLRVCDYKSVFKTIDLFKTRFTDEVTHLETSASSSDKAKLKEIGMSVQKMNLVEAETIQRLYLDENGKKRSGSVAKIAKGSNEMSFPAQDDEELWLDELEGYKVTLKGCLARDTEDQLSVSKSVASSKGAK
jgi:tetratricopeptide (TPR) repeat protein